MGLLFTDGIVEQCGCLIICAERGFRLTSIVGSGSVFGVDDLGSVIELDPLVENLYPRSSVGVALFSLEK